MTLSTHALTGAIIVSLLPNEPVVGLTVAFLSHFVLDMIPHRDYELLSLNQEAAKRGVVEMAWGRAFIWDLGRIGGDALLGLVLAVGLGFFLDGQWPLLLLGGALAGMLPDFLQFWHGLSRWRILDGLQRFHATIHTKIRLKNNLFLGVISQVGLVILLWMTRLWLS
ncbi:MAG: hypothetical protein A2589_01530 [Candidatus Vogelbacteria bacterium RIFOXYD1_FULL_46_19]|jgi:hypothetical protein|uniref:Uncharacterized protein n=1 Tax=Candidatus Vogelbacteria bacterium RIFOXYD1_FULL_46_19 TaxID=1802439 RepID=A0A1G2QFY4_9BACT|nr:MAG: hypothetical protein A2589_01530 [Candidatus Vogelbacteria bacterium RIFOXYD1_FULL_46_19]